MYYIQRLQNDKQTAANDNINSKVWQYRRHKNCHSLLFGFDNHTLKLVYRSTPAVAERFLTMVYSAIKIAGPANPELTSNDCQIATKQLRNGCRKKFRIEIRYWKSCGV